MFPFPFGFIISFKQFCADADRHDARSAEMRARLEERLKEYESKIEELKRKQQ